MGQEIIDEFTLLHIYSGVLFYYLNIPFITASILHLLFEIIENRDSVTPYINKIRFWPGGKRTPDSIINSTFDQLSFMIAWLLAYYFEKNNKH
jgi:hypothetical protein